MSARLTPTEAVLAAAAAVTTDELHAARLALIECGGAMLRDLDPSGLVGSGWSMGSRLLGASTRPGVTSCADRVSRIGEHVRRYAGERAARLALVRDDGAVRVDVQVFLGVVAVLLAVAWLFGWPW